MLPIYKCLPNPIFIWYIQLITKCPIILARQACRSRQSGKNYVTPSTCGSGVGPDRSGEGVVVSVLTSAAVAGRGSTVTGSWPPKSLVGGRAAAIAASGWWKTGAAATGWLENCGWLAWGDSGRKDNFGWRPGLTGGGRERTEEGRGREEGDRWGSWEWWGEEWGRCGREGKREELGLWLSSNKETWLLSWQFLQFFCVFKE